MRDSSWSRSVFLKRLLLLLEELADDERVVEIVRISIARGDPLASDLQRWMTERLYHRFHAYLTEYCVRRLGGDLEGREVGSDSITVFCYRAVPALRQPLKSVRAYLTTIAKNACKARLRERSLY